MPTTPTNSWQEVRDDNLPEIGKIVFLWDGDSIWIGGRDEGGELEDGEGGWLWGNSYGSFWWNGERWEADVECDDDYKPTHWMEMPLPPTKPGTLNTAEELKAAIEILKRLTSMLMVSGKNKSAGFAASAKHFLVAAEDSLNAENKNSRNYPGTRQLCTLCDEPTGRCEDDSLYADDESGPYCVKCWLEMRDRGSTNATGSATEGRQ